jgi:SAM-dependent methyltransferase
MRVNLGCGSQVPKGWLNVDYALGARFAKKPFWRKLNRKLRLFELDWNERIYLHDLRKEFPWDECTVDVVYSSHTLEHFSREDGRRFLAECHRVLRENGIIRVVVPDLMYHVSEYLEGRVRADHFVEKLGVLYESRNSSLKSRLARFIHFPHKCMYDTSSLLETIIEAGFMASTREPFDSDIKDIGLIEVGGRTENAVIVEGRKR